LIQSRNGLIQDERSEIEGHPREISSEEEVPKCSRRERRPVAANFNNFKVEIPEFKGKLYPDKFLKWLHTVERIFEYKEVPSDKKVPLFDIRLCKYASL